MQQRTLLSTFFCTTGITLALFIVDNSKAMDKPLTRTLPTKADYMREADETVQVLEKSEIPGITKPLTHLQSTFPGKSFLEIHRTLLKHPDIQLTDLTDQDKRELVTWYQKIYVQLSRMKPEEKAAHPLRFYKTRIYAIGLALFGNNKEATKAWLKSADCFSDEEKEIDDFTTHKSASTYRRTHYLAGKHSLTIQQNRNRDAEAFTQTLKSHQQAASALNAQTEQLDAQIRVLCKQRNALIDQKQENTEKQRCTMQALETNGTSIANANIVYNESLIALQQQLLDRTARIQQLKEEIEILNEQDPQDAPDREAKKKSLQKRVEEISQCTTEQAAIQRDIDLLTGEYSLVKKVLWKLSGTITNYPIEAPTPGSPTERSDKPAEEQKE